MGPKGEKGSFGADGSPGKVGPRGPIGPPGKADKIINMLISIIQATFLIKNFIFHVFNAKVIQPKNMKYSQGWHNPALEK